MCPQGTHKGSSGTWSLPVSFSYCTHIFHYHWVECLTRVLI